MPWLPSRNPSRHNPTRLCDVGSSSAISSSAFAFNISRFPGIDCALAAVNAKTQCFITSVHVGSQLWMQRRSVPSHLSTWGRSCECKDTVFHHICPRGVAAVNAKTQCSITSVHVGSQLWMQRRSVPSHLSTWGRSCECKDAVFHHICPRGVIVMFIFTTKNIASPQGLLVLDNGTHYLGECWSQLLSLPFKWLWLSWQCRWFLTFSWLWEINRNDNCSGCNSYYKTYLIKLTNLDCIVSIACTAFKYIPATTIYFPLQTCPN